MAKKFYWCGHISAEILENHSTQKAFYTDYSWDGMTNKGRRVWIPKSICKFSEPNEFGNIKVMIPRWFFTNNDLDYMRMMDISWCSGNEFLIQA